MTDDSPFEFPTSFPIKAMGRETPEFRNLIVELIAEHAEFDRDADVRLQASSNGTFLSVTVTFQAISREQLDTVYQALNDHEAILMVF